VFQTTTLLDREASPASALSRPTRQLFISVEKDLDLYAPRQQAWTALVHEPTSRRKQTFRGSRWHQNGEKVAGDSSSMRVCISMLPPPRQQVTFRSHHRTEISIKLCRQRCLGHFATMCDKTQCGAADSGLYSGHRYVSSARNFSDSTNDMGSMLPTSMSAISGVIFSCLEFERTRWTPNAECREFRLHRRWRRLKHFCVNRLNVGHQLTRGPTDTR